MREEEKKNRKTKMENIIIPETEIVEFNNDSDKGFLEKRRFDKYMTLKQRQKSCPWLEVSISKITQCFNLPQMEQ